MSSGAGGTYASAEYRGLVVTAFANAKGGVGRTSLCANVSAALAQQGLRVLCVDLDPQAGLTTALGMASHCSPATGTSALLSRGDVPLASAVIPTDIENLDLVSAGPQLAECAEALTGDGREQVLRARLMESCRDGGSGYDLVLLDCPPSLGLLTRNALAAATHLVVPVLPRLAAFRGAAALGGLLEALHQRAGATAKLLGFVVTMCDGGICLDVTLYRLLRTRIEDEFGDYVFTTVIGHSPVIGEAEAGGVPVVLSQPDSLAAAWYRALADEMLDRLRRDSSGISGTLAQTAAA